ncbi:dynein regulatory complex protein 9-like [Corticium candelabrum]|uniref:dynein regulatory complex protein 9-like n=1 Tax=Corticium candelabrum TaxID=121492 RepID=UPI002E258D09|nr:dynein regulatory complex protein 9-like [Corticium candelabrum]
MAAATGSRPQPVATTLPPLEAQYVAAVFEHCLDQLEVLGNIVPSFLDMHIQDRRDSASELTQIIDGQRRMDMTYQELTVGSENGSQVDINAELFELNRALKSSTKVLARAMKQEKDTTEIDNMLKMQQDRAFLHNILSSTLDEMLGSQSFTSLIEAVEREKDEKEKRHTLIQRVRESQQQVKELQEKIVEVRKQKEEEIQKCNERIAHLKDQLQEMKARKTMEIRFDEKNAELAVLSTQKRCRVSEKQLEDDIERLKREIEEEENANAEIEVFLRQHHEDLSSQVEYWMNKHEKDVQMKQDQLDSLKAAKDSDLARLKELTEKYTEYEEVVVDERMLCEKAKRRAEQEQLEANAAIKLQAWWRGILVRHQLGPYSKKKKGKKSGKKSGKKGKKGGKKKKK